MNNSIAFFEGKILYSPVSVLSDAAHSRMTRSSWSEAGCGYWQCVTLPENLHHRGIFQYCPVGSEDLKSPPTGVDLIQFRDDVVKQGQ